MRRGSLSWQFACSTFAHEFRCADLRIDECFNILHIRRMNSFSQLTVFHFIQLFDTFLFIPAGVLSLSSLLWGIVTKIIDVVFIPMSCVSKTFYADSRFVLFTKLVYTYMRVLPHIFLQCQTFDSRKCYFVYSAHFNTRYFGCLETL